MKFLQIFTKTPKHKKFSYEPRFYDPREEERKERENRIRQELEIQQQAARENQHVEQNVADAFGYRQRIAGSFRQAKKTANVQSDPSAAMLRLIILLILTLGLIAYLQWGKVAIYGVFIVSIPLYLLLKYRRINVRKSDNQK